VPHKALRNIRNLFTENGRYMIGKGPSGCGRGERGG